MFKKRSHAGQSDRALKLWAAAGGEHLNGLKLIVILGFWSVDNKKGMHVFLYLSHSAPGDFTD